MCLSIICLLVNDRLVDILILRKWHPVILGLWLVSKSGLICSPDWKVGTGELILCV